MNYARFINRVSAARQASPIRRVTEIVAAAGPELISFGAGSPNPKCFPLASIQLTDKLQNVYPLEGAKLHHALQYSQTPGIPALRTWLRELQCRIHSPPTANLSADDDSALDLMVVPGSQDGLSKLFEMFLSPGDTVILEEPAYPGTLATVRPMGVTIAACATDGEGTLVESLRSTIAAHPTARVLYLQPNASNPAGVTTTGDRRREVYELARAHDLLIVEDDPYRYLLFEEPPPSYLSMDTDGRVIRLDSVSKIMSSGIRLGFVTGPRSLLNQLQLHLQVSSMHCSTLSQVIVLELLTKIGQSGFDAHCRGVGEFYAAQCSHMVSAAERHLSDLCTWHQPRGGMFLWLTAKHVRDTKAMIEQRAMRQNVVLIPGSAFFVDDTAPTPHMRASFSAATPEQIDVGFGRLAALLREEADNQ